MKRVILPSPLMYCGTNKRFLSRIIPSSLAYSCPYQTNSSVPKINKKDDLMARVLNGPRREKTCLRKFANNKGADQSAHPHSLISALVIRCLESTISKLATSEIAILNLVSVADESGLSLSLSETRKTGFLVTRPK